MHPVISVIIPAYNEEKLLKRCIESLQQQTYAKEKYEIIVVDNGSTDKTPLVAKECGVTVLHYTKKHIVAAVRNFGASHAKGAIFAFVDADSVVSKTLLEQMAAYLQNDKLVAIAGKAMPQNDAPHLRLMFELYHSLLLTNQFFGVVLPWGFNLAIKKEQFNQLGGFDEHLSTYDDASMGLRLQKTFGKKAIKYTGDLVVYTSTRKQEKVKNLSQYALDTIKNYTNFVILKRYQAAQIRNVR